MIRSAYASALCLPLLLAGCPDSHGLGSMDAGPDGAIGTTDGGRDATIGATDVSMRGMCPPGINPWDPTDPLSACSVEGATCSSGTSDPCGSALFCTCTSGGWNCGHAEPDPVCYCGREPSEGDRCTEEGASCGQCCPTAEGPNWAPMQCVDGHWTPGGCPPIECPPIATECPVDTASVVGASCGIEFQICGDACCGSAITCLDGRWVPGPDADCLCRPNFDCGRGSCREGQACVSRCGPADGIEYLCVTPPLDCADCGCLPLDGDQRCEMVDGHPFISQPGFCG